MLIKLLIVFFIILLVYQIFTFFSIQKEGLTNNSGYTDYTINSQNALILAQQNAGNINVLKEQIGQCNAYGPIIQDISHNLSTLQSQVNALASSQTASA